ncbi:hypothetical protein JHK82_047913 [Glycine max]|nr:hypothetical protein JHK82_047913 [Glycine max]
MQIVRHCKGLPLAIKVIGRSLSNQPYELWQKMVEKLSQGHSILDSNTKLVASLKKISDVLEDNSIIKECFIDLALFPENQKIPVAALVDMWVELYGLDNDGIVMANVNKLASMNLANVLETRYNETCTSYWSHLQPTQAEVLILNLQTSQYTFPKFLKEMSKLKVLIVIRHGFHPSEMKNFESLDSLSNLRRMRLERISVPPFVMLKNLKKLSLYFCNTRQAFENGNMLISDALPILEDLNIDYCNDMVELPTGLCEITSLKMLSITNCHKLSALPQEIGNLENLKLIRLSSCTDLEGIPNSIGRLSNLRHMDISNCISLPNLPEDFGNLCNLRNLYMTSCARCELPPSIINLEHLKEVVCDEETAASWDAFKPMLPNLKIDIPQLDVNLNWLHEIHS